MWAAATAAFIIIIIIYLLNKAIEKKKCSNMNSRAGQQGKGTDSCPEIRELHKTIMYALINYFCTLGK